MADLQAEGRAVDEHLSGRLHSPVGLSIGAATPDEVAPSMAAELQALRTGQTGGRLREAAGPIHARLVGVSAASEWVS